MCRYEESLYRKQGINSTIKCRIGGNIEYGLAIGGGHVLSRVLLKIKVEYGGKEKIKNSIMKMREYDRCRDKDSNFVSVI